MADEALTRLATYGEEDAYRRVVIRVRTASGDADACISALADSSAPPGSRAWPAAVRLRLAGRPESAHHRYGAGNAGFEPAAERVRQR